MVKHGWFSLKQAKLMKNAIHINKKYGGPYKIYGDNDF